MIVKFAEPEVEIPSLWRQNLLIKKNVSNPPFETKAAVSFLMPQGQGWGEYWTYEYKYWKISTRVVLEYSVFSIFMFIILGKTSTQVVLAPALRKVFYA